MDTTDTIIGATVVVTGSTLIRNAVQKKSHAAPIVFGFLMAASLLVISMATPRFAKGLSYMAMVGAFVVNGPTVFKLMGTVKQGHSPLIKPGATGSVPGKGIVPPPLTGPGTPYIPPAGSVPPIVGPNPTWTPPWPGGQMGTAP